MNYQLFDQLSINVLVVSFCQHDTTVQICHLNPAACHLLGYSNNDLHNVSITFISKPETQVQFWQTTLNNLTSDVQASPFEFEFISKQRQTIPVIISIASIDTTCAADQNDSCYVLYIQEISSIKYKQNSSAMMQLVVEQTASAVVITDPSGKIEYVNQQYTELTGFSEEELIGEDPKILQSGNTSPEFYQALWEVLIKTGQWQGEIKNKKKNGHYYWANETISTIKNEQGQVTHLLAIEEDITQRKLAESALLESEQRFRQMAEMTGEWLWEQDPDGYYIYSSVAVESILDFQAEDIIGKHYTEMLTSSDKIKQRHFSVFHEPFYTLTNLYRHRDGHKVMTESTGLPIKDETGKLVKWRGVDRDITARKHFENALIESEKRKRLIIESALNAIIIMDSYGIISDWNIQAEKMFGWSRQEAINKRLDELIIPTHFRQAHRRGLQKFLHTEQGPVLNHLIEYTAMHRNGNEFPVEISVAALKLGNAYIFSGFIHDISARKAAEKTLREAQVKMAITQKEMEIAHRIQASLLPSEPIITNDFEVTGCCLPADQVGGDYFDFFYQDENYLDMLIADVSGHAIGPALFMVETRSALRTQANWQGTPGQTLSALNTVLFQDLYNADYFITLFYVQFNIETEHLTYASAGHPTPLLYNHQWETCTRLDADGLIFGVRKEVDFEQKSVPFSSGDTLLLYTDGLIEAESTQGEFFGVDRVCKIFRENIHLDAQNLIDEIIAQLKQFCAKDSFNDDISLLVFKRK